MKQKKLVKTVILVLSAAMIGGCGAQGSNQGDSQAVQETSAAVSESQSSSDGAYEPVTIVNGEREITFTKMPQKVLCANLYAAENMVMLGLGDRVVGRIAPANPAERPLPELEDEFAAIPEVEKSHENAVALGTDLVIGQVSAFKESAWGSYDQLESKGIQCLTITGTIVSDETVEHIYTDIENLGKIFKVEDRAEELIEDIRSQIEETQKAVSSVPENEKPKVFVLDTFKGNEIYTTSKGLQSNLIELAGGINCTRNMDEARWFNTSVETLVETNPDWIIINDYGAQTVDEKKEFLDTNPALSEIPAVKNKKYLVIPLVEVMQDVRAAKACRTFAETFHPECFQ